MVNGDKYKIFFYILLAVFIFGWVKYGDLKEKNSLLSDELSEYQYALSQANQNIEEANSIIEDAQSYAWSTYQEMGDALDNLYTVDTVEP